MTWSQTRIDSCVKVKQSEINVYMLYRFISSKEAHDFETMSNRRRCDVIMTSHRRLYGVVLGRVRARLVLYGGIISCGLYDLNR